MHNKEKVPQNRQNGGRVALFSCISPQKNAFRGHNKDLFLLFWVFMHPWREIGK